MTHFVGGKRVSRKYPPNPQPCKAGRLGLRLRLWIVGNKWLPKNHVQRGE